MSGPPPDKSEEANESPNKVSPVNPPATGAPAGTGRLSNQQLLGPTVNPLDPNAAGNQQQRSTGPKLTFEAACERPELFN